MRNRGYGPTVREIGREFGIKSPNGVMCHLRALEARGSSTASRTCPGPLTCWPSRCTGRGLPLAGRIAAGVLHEAIEQNEEVDFGDLFDSDNRNLIVLEVQGESMIEDQIADGDYVGSSGGPPPGRARSSSR